MPGPLLHQGAVVMCAHGGQAQPASTIPRVLVSGMPIAVQPFPHMIAGCPLPSSSGGPCVTAQWIVASTRVLSMGMPVLLMDSQAVAAPTGAPVKPVGVQPRVIGM